MKSMKRNSNPIDCEPARSRRYRNSPGPRRCQQGLLLPNVLDSQALLDWPPVWARQRGVYLVAVLLREHLGEEPLPRVDHEPGTVHHVALGDLLRPISERLNLLPDARGVRHLLGLG